MVTMPVSTAGLCMKRLVAYLKSPRFRQEGIITGIRLSARNRSRWPVLLMGPYFNGTRPLLQPPNAAIKTR